MKLWDLSGPRRFVASVCSLLVEGAIVVVRFPGRIPAGFEDALAFSLGNTLVMTHMKALENPMESICSRFLPDINIRLCTISDICQDEQFQGRLIWLNGLDSTNWPAWRDFLELYSQVSRSMPLLGRTLFLAPLSGTPPESPPDDDVALGTVEWDGLSDPIDLMTFINEHLQHRCPKDIQRLLLVMTVAEVASWDFDSPNIARAARSW